MRSARITAEGEGYYHGIPRIIERRRILGEAEKQRLLKRMRCLAAFGGLEILTGSRGAGRSGRIGRNSRCEANKNCRATDRVSRMALS
jgi:hypothetical protein